jgi:hypothetical protein
VQDVPTHLSNLSPKAEIFLQYPDEYPIFIFQNELAGTFDIRET